MRPLREDERPVAVRTLAAALASDPLYQWFLPPARRRRWLEWIMAASLAGLPAGGAVTGDQGAAGAVLGAAAPGHAGHGVSWRRALSGLGLALWRWPSLRLARRGPALLRAMARARPAEPHHYLAVLGVHPERQGHGLGGRLLAAWLGAVDGGGQPAYLETSNEANLGFYQRVGFTVRDRLEPGGGAPSLWTMWRPGRGG